MELIFPLLILVLLVPLFLGSRRQKKAMASAKALQESLQVGDKVMTSAGLHAIVAGLQDTTVGTGATVVRTHAVGASIGPGAEVGPFAYLRPAADLGENSKVGTFVEVKKSTIGAHTKVPHLTYVGDATIGEHSNIGASSVFVNYDGVAKHQTVIGDHCRTGSDTMFIAPVTVGDGAYSGAGTVIKDDVPPGALAVSGGRQRNIDDWVITHRPETGSAEAALRLRNESQKDGHS